MEHVFDEDELNYEHLTGRMIDLKGSSDNNLWESSAIAILLIEKMCAPAKKVSGSTGYTPSYLTKMVQTFLAFPEEGDRAHDMSYSVHMKCALSKTEMPEYWLNKSVECAYTVRELVRVMKGLTPKPTPLEIAEKAWTKIELLLDCDDEGSTYLSERIGEYR